MSNIATKVIKTFRERPFYMLKYAREAIEYTLSHLVIRLTAGSNITVGRNPHVINPLCFKSERPDAYIKVGDNFTAYAKCSVSAWGHGKINIGAYCSFGRNTSIDSRNSVTIGDHVLISWDVMITDYNPHPIDPNQRAIEMEHSTLMLWPQFARMPAGRAYTPDFTTAPIAIQDNVWIGARAIILKGVTIGQGSIVGAGAVVAGDIPPYSIAAGNPAKVVKKITQTT